MASPERSSNKMHDSGKGKTLNSVKKIFKQMRSENAEVAFDRLTSMLQSKRDTVLAACKAAPVLQASTSVGGNTTQGEAEISRLGDPIRENQQSASSSVVILPRLPSSNDTRRTGSSRSAPKRQFDMQQRYKAKLTKHTIRSIRLRKPHKAFPSHITCVALSSNYLTEDNKTLFYVPYLDEDQNDTMADQLFGDGLYDTSFRERLMENGPIYRQHENNILIDKVLTASLIEMGFQDVTQTPEDDDEVDFILQCVSQAMALPLERIEERFAHIRKGGEPGISQGTAVLETQSSSASTHASASTVTTPNSESKAAKVKEQRELLLQKQKEEEEQDEDDKAYLEGIDSYRKLYCRQCYTYDCNLHGIFYKPSLRFQYERGLDRERTKTKAALSLSSAQVEVNAEEESNSAAQAIEVKPPAQQLELASDAEEEVSDGMVLSDFHKKIMKRMYLIFSGNQRDMATAMGVPQSLIAQYIEGDKYCLPVGSRYAAIKSNRKKDTDMPYFSVRNYRPKWYTAIQKAEIHPLFYPCLHEEPCQDDGCSCVMNKFFCTKACSWGDASPNFFRGCECQGGCNRTHCTCFASKRECDPDLCKCGTCCDPPRGPAFHQKCRNDNLLMERQPPLVVGQSSVAGWGLFNKYPLRKGDFIVEYVGEVISQEEAERRGRIDDAKNRSYLFILSSDYVLDASRLGNKARFINHSNEPNCLPKVLFVKGAQRIGLFAKEDIKAQSELFFDYRYNVAIENDLIKKAAMSFDWMTKQAYSAASTTSASVTTAHSYGSTTATSSNNHGTARTAAQARTASHREQAPPRKKQRRST